MKWYNYLWIAVRYVLFAILWYVAASVVFGIFLGAAILINGGLSHNPDQIGHEIQHITLSPYVQYAGITALVLGCLISGFQHFRYYKNYKLKDKQ